MAKGFRIKINLDKPKLDSLILKKKRLIQRNVKNIVLKEVIPHVVDLVMVEYDELSQLAEEGVGHDDPSRPSEWRAIFRAHLLESANDSFKSKRNVIEVGMGDRAFLGDLGTFVDDEDAEPLHWMVFFLEGLVGEFALITPKTYAKLKPNKEFDDSWGRFEDKPVFMIERKAYFKQGFNEIISWDLVRHPFSGVRPPDIFATALAKLNMRPFIKKAIKAAIEGKEI
jgi:hypothetical protein